MRQDGDGISIEAQVDQCKSKQAVEPIRSKGCRNHKESAIFIIVVIITCFLKCNFKWTLNCDVTSIHN